MPESKLNLKDAIYRWRVRSAPVALIAVLVLARPTPLGIGIGIGVSLLGLFIRAWASGHIKKEKVLAVTGPYRFSRNPLYLGNSFLGLGITLGTQSWWCLGIFVVYFVLFYPPAIREEREKMRRLFPDEYDAYRRNVPLFFPTFNPVPPAETRRWDFALYKKNGEYRALLGTVIVWAIFAAKMVLR
jgi:protein-S-isoprenylcysteine O-methyltransferase Ste14